MATVSTEKAVLIKVCDLCEQPLEPYYMANRFQFKTHYKEERPLKRKWYQALLYAFDGNPEYDVHHSCMYRLLRGYMEGDLVRSKEDK